MAKWLRANMKFVLLIVVIVVLGSYRLEFSSGDTRLKLEPAQPLPKSLVR
jgi:hypothetical protein